jgi:hypothetical protein
MTILYDFGTRGNFEPLWRAQTWAFQAWAFQTWAFQTRAFQTWALQRLISFNCAGGDVRWAIIALALRSFTVLWVFGQRQFVLLVRNVAGRAGQGACFAADITDADSMVAAGSS